MAKSKKSKILAMALCASVMTGIYASPVMATELYVDGDQWVTTKVVGATQITSLEGLKEITLGNSVKITTDGKGIIRVGAVNGVNTRVHNDGFYINKTGHDQKTSLTAGTLTLAGNKLTFAQLANINTVIGANGVINAADGSTVGGVKMNAGRVSGNGFFVKGSGNALGTAGLKLGDEYLDKTKLGAINDVITDEGAVVSKGDVTSKTAGGTTTYSLNTVGANTSGITRDIEGKVTTIEGAFSVDKKGHIYNANRSFQVTKDGAARFGDYNNANVRMENGVLTVNRTGETDVAKLDAQGLTLTSDTAKATLSAEQLARLNTVVTQNGESIVVTADHFKNTNESFAVDSNGAVKAANGKFNVGAKGDVAILYADDGAIVADENGFGVQKGSAQAVVTNDGVGLAAGLKADGSAAARISVTDDGIGLQGGTSEVVLNSNNGAVFTNGEGNGETVINGGSITTNRITTGTVNGVAIGMNGDGDITLGNNVVIDGDFNSDNIAGITRVERNDSAPGSEVTYIEKNTAVSADGIVVTDQDTGVSTKTKYDGFYVKDKDSNIVSSLKDDGLMLTDPGSGVSTKTKYDGFYVKDKDSNIVSSLKDDGLMLTDQESGKQTLNATDIADIKGIDREGAGDPGNGTTTIEGATSFTKDGMVTSNITTDNITTDSFTAGVTEDSIYHINAEGEMLFRSGDNYIGMNRDGIGFTSGTESVTINGDGTTFTSGDSTTRTTTSTVIKGGTITTGTLNVDKIVLGDKIVNKDTGDVIGGELEIGADVSIKIDDAGTDAVEFNATKTALSANYGGTSLNMNSYGFNLNNGTDENAASLVLNGSGFAFEGPVHLGKGTQVKFSHNGNDISLSTLVNRVEDLEQKTTGISFDENTGNTTIKDMNKGTDGKWTAGDSSVTVGDNGATFENGEGNGTTNINGGAIDADSSSIGNDVSGGSGSGSSGMTGNGTYTDGSKHSGHFVDGNNSYEFTNDANGFTGTVTDGKNTTTIKNGAMGSNTTVKGNNVSASSGVGIGNDGAFISDSVTNGDISHTVDGGSITDTVTNGDMTVTEVKDKNGSATTVKDANGSSTVSQDTKGQTVSTGTGTSVNTGNDFGVTDNETGKSIYMSDIGHVEDIDSEIQNSDGSKTTVVDAVNNEAEIRRNEIERVDGRINNLENRVGKLEDRVDKVGAMSAAIANLRTMGYDPAAPTEIAVGVGQYRSETGVALGMFHYPNRDFMLSLSVSTSGDEVMGGIGATWKFGRKSPEKVAEIKKAQAEADARRAEEAKLAKAEEMKQAAKEAKIKAQQERHAKLAAQAEAAK